MGGRSKSLLGAFAFLGSLRYHRRLDKSDIADDIGVTAAQITRWENGKSTNPNLQNFQAWADRLGVGLHVVLAIAESGATEDQIEEIARRAAAGLDDAEILALLHQMVS